MKHRQNCYKRRIDFQRQGSTKQINDSRTLTSNRFALQFSFSPMVLYTESLLYTESAFTLFLFVSLTKTYNLIHIS